MARQEDACWRCGTNWAAEDDPPTTLRLVTAGAIVDVSRAAIQARLDAHPIHEGARARV
jgi:hypothetical protein